MEIEQDINMMIILCACLQQYWADRTRPYEFVPVQAFADAFEASPTGRGNAAALEQPFQRGPKDSLDALVRTKCAPPTG